jgi:hypothetical protein
LDAGAAFLSGKSPMPIDDAEKGTLLHIGRLSKSEEKIYDLTEKAEDLLLEKERLESIAEIAIAAGAPDANAAVLAADEASSAALLAMGIIMEAQTAKELADNERDERARMTSVERAAKVVERDRKRAEKAEEEAQRVAKAAERDAKWTEDIDASIERMIDDGVSYAKIASDLGNGLSTSDIYHRWNRYLKKSSSITKPPVQPGVKSRITWTEDIDASIERMIDDGVSYAKIASDLGNGLSKSDIVNRWNRYLKKSSSITKPPMQPGVKSRITWTEDIDASIERMIDDGVSCAKIASELGNGLSKNDIENRWNRHLKDKL